MFNYDNVSTNDEAVRYILSVINLAKKDPSSRKARYLNYIINLATKAFLFRKSVKVFEFKIAKEEEDIFNIEKARLT